MLLSVSCLVAAGCGEETADETSGRVAASELERIEADQRRLARRLERLQERAAAGRADTGGRSSGAGGGALGLDGAERLEEKLDAEIGVTAAPAGAGPIASAGSVRSGSAWSTIKVPIALRLLEDQGGPEGLASGEEELIGRALTASDNDAAAALFDRLGARHGGSEGAAAAVTALLREAGDQETTASPYGRDGFSPYGQTDWSLAAQHRFMNALVSGGVGSAASRALVLDLMGRVTSDSWGLGSIGVPARWKGGWGPDADGSYLLRQMGVVELEAGEYLVTLAVRPNDGGFESGQRAATELAAWLQQRLGEQPR